MEYLPAELAAVFYVFLGLFGLVFGSFCNAWAWRIANGESIVKGRSHCAVCGHSLNALDLVPLLSWLFLGGKCRYCKAKISFRYPLIELICCAYFVTIGWRYGFTFDTLRLLALGCLLLVASLVDWDTMELPDGLLIAAAVFSLLRLTEPGAWKDMLIGLVAVPLPLLGLVLLADKILKKESMGGGDIKLMAVLGLHFGWKLSLLILIFACILGLLAALLTKKLGKPFPFGPALSAAAWLTALVGSSVLGWYLSLF